MEKIGRYRVVRPLGQGGVGQVFLAEDPTLERAVALKLLHRGGTGLREEAKALAALSHPGIVTVFEIGEHEGREFIAMEYLPGRPLREVLMQGSAARAELVAICAKVAVAVAAAHRAGILHRDIKPENIVVTDEHAPAVKVVDFGIARRLHEHKRPMRAATAQELVDLLTTGLATPNGTATVVSAGTHTVFGTPAYMAPEVLQGEPSSEASDVYSLGVVVHECIAGRRPFQAGSLAELIILALESVPPRLADPLGELIARMLAATPAARPSLDEVAARLAEPAPPPAQRPGRALAIVAGLAAVAAIGVGLWFAQRDDDAPSALVAPVVVVKAKIAVAPVVVEVQTYGAERPGAEVMADVLAQVLAKVTGAQLTGIAMKDGTSDVRTFARGVEADFYLTATIALAGDKLRARIVLTRTATDARVAAFDVDAPPVQIAALLDAITERVAGEIAPGAKFDRTPDRLLARRLYQQGEPLRDASRFRYAWTYLEQAVDVDPTFFEAWYALTFVLAWQEAPEEMIVHAAEQALRLAPPGPKRELVRGVSLFLATRYTDARLALEPIEPALAQTDRRELFYFLGEANWHDGRHDAAYAYFKRTLDADREFRPATIHMSQYAIARRDPQSARYLVGISGENYDAIDMATGRYEELATAGKPNLRAAALLVLGRPLPGELESTFGGGIDRGAFVVSRALADGDRERARELFAQTWTEHVAGRTLASHAFYALEALGEAVIAGALPEESRRLVELLAAESKHQPKRGYHRLAIAAAALLRDPALIPRDRLTERHIRFAEAATAELAGDRGTAARILTELVGNPTFTWDIVERAALLRNLRELGRDRDVAALCTDTLKPPVFRVSWLPLRRDCVSATGSRTPDRRGTPRR